MSGPFSSIGIRLELSTRSLPPIPPIDALTQETPKFWRGGDISFDVGIFDSAGFPVDLSNLSFLSVSIFPYPRDPRALDTNYSYAAFSILPFPSAPPAPLLFKTVAAADITGLISKEEWRDGLCQNATFEFSDIDTASLDLGGQPQARFVVVVQGLLTDGRSLVYGGGPLTVFESGVQGVYLPDDVAPLIVPYGAILYLRPNTQIPFSEPIQVAGSIISDGGVLSQVGGGSDSMPSNSYNAQTVAAAGTADVTPVYANHTEAVTITATTGTVNLVLLTDDTLAGARIALDLVLPAVAGVVVNVYNLSTGGTLLAVLVTDGTYQTLSAFLQFVSDGTNWKTQAAQVPAL